MRNFNTFLIAGILTICISFGTAFAASPVMIVKDDGNGKDTEIWSENLKELRIQHDIWDIRSSGAPSYEAIQEYKALIWSCGDQGSNSLNRTNQNLLQRFYDSGKSIILSGSRVAGNFGWSSRFFSDVFGVEYVEWRTDINKLNGRDTMSGTEFEPWGAVEVVKLDSFGGSFNNAKITFGLQFRQGTQIPYSHHEMREYGAASIAGHFGRSAMFFSFSLDSIWSSMEQYNIVRNSMWHIGRSIMEGRNALASIENKRRAISNEHAKFASDSIIKDLSRGNRSSFDSFVKAVKASKVPGKYAPVAYQIRDYANYALVSGDDDLADLEPLFRSVINDLDDLEPLVKSGDLSELEPLYTTVVNRDDDDDLNDLTPLLVAGN